MSSEMVISQNRPQERLGTLGNRPVRILCSGRFERINGADDAVWVAGICPSEA
jgi:hypothetical protein